jgi:hypothetical protein
VALDWTTMGPITSQARGGGSPGGAGMRDAGSGSPAAAPGS